MCYALFAVAFAFQYAMHNKILGEVFCVFN